MVKELIILRPYSAQQKKQLQQLQPMTIIKTLAQVGKILRRGQLIRKIIVSSYYQ